MQFISNFRTSYFLLLLLLSIQSVIAQTIHQQEMQKLNFMIGDWVGISKTYKNDSIVKQVPAYQKIQFLLNKNIITIDLNSETLKLHTVIYYDEKDGKYYYNPYYKNGNAIYPAELKNGKLTVSPNKNKRFIFEPISTKSFREYGEIFKNGKWIKYFEDVFKK